MYAQLLSCVLTFCDPLDFSLPVSSTCGIFQTKILEWVAISSSRGFSQPRDQTHVFRVSCMQTDSLPLSRQGTLVWILSFTKKCILVTICYIAFIFFFLAWKLLHWLVAHLEKEMVPHSSILAWESHGHRSLAGYSLRGCKQLDVTEWLHFHFKLILSISMGFPVAQLGKNLPAIRETSVWSLGWENPLEKGKATHSSILAWRIPWTV